MYLATQKKEVNLDSCRIYKLYRIRFKHKLSGQNKGPYIFENCEILEREKSINMDFSKWRYFHKINI